MIKTGGGDLNDFSILESTVRQKSMVHVDRQRLSQISMEKLIEKPLRFSALHWDGKMVKDIGMGGNPGRDRLWCSVRTCKLLLISDPRGISQADASIEMLTVWDQTNSIVALVFYTTASNTGIHKWATKLIMIIIQTYKAPSISLPNPRRWILMIGNHSSVWIMRPIDNTL